MLNPDPPIPAGVFATEAIHPCVVACAPLLTHPVGALRCGARVALGWIRLSANALRVAGGSGFVEGGAPIATDLARMLGCNSEVIAVTEREGLAIDVGRSMRFPTKKQRLAVWLRDQHCVFPGCLVPARRTDPHHLQHWIEGGPTDVENLYSLCRFHHRRVHDGTIRIFKRGDALRFETSDGHVIATPVGAIPLAPTTPAPVDCNTPVALNHGEAYSSDHAVWVTMYACELAEKRAAGPETRAP